ncbi:hypothetical protein ES703_121469 [subsurface metagenome]
MQARSRLYGRRIKGDLDLGLEPSRIDPGGERRLAEIITPGGLIPGGSEQDILEESEKANYRIGTRRVMDDRVFRYCYTKEVLSAQLGAFMSPKLYWEGNGNMGLAAQFATEVEFDNKDGVAVPEEVIAIHQLADGWVAGVALPGPDLTSLYCMKIKDNEASHGASAGDVETCKITLYRKMPLGIFGAGHRSYVYPNIYANVVAHGGAAYNQCLGTVVCVPLFKVTAKRYFWGLTWGIFYGICGTWGENVGQTVNKRIFHFDGNGAMVYEIGRPDVDQYFQPGGYIMMNGQATEGGAILNGDQLCFLHLSP